MESIKLTLTGRPASKKNSRRIIFRYGKPITIPSKAYKRFETEALEQILEQGLTGKNITEPIKLTLIFEQKGNYEQDLSNAIASIEDVLEKARVIKNDLQVMMLNATKTNGHSDWRTEIEIEKT